VSTTYHASALCVCGHSYGEHVGRGKNRQCRGILSVNNAIDCLCKSFRFADAAIAHPSRKPRS
jgi:hypothetical protein